MLDPYDEFRKALYTLGVISIDQLMLDFMGYLDSFRWDIKRESEGFDAIFVDEFHLFNSVERSTFLSLLKDRSAVPALLMAYDTRQSPRETYFGLDTEVTLSDATPEKFSVRKARQFELTDIFRLGLDTNNVRCRLSSDGGMTGKLATLATTI